MKRNVFDAEIVWANLFAIGSVFQHNPFANSRNELYFIVLAIPGFIDHPQGVHGLKCSNRRSSIACCVSAWAANPQRVIITS